MLIPYATRHTTAVTAAAAKRVCCEQCDGEYVYTMSMTGHGQSTSLLFLDESGAATRSRAEAEASAAASLEQGCAIVPCPTCGHIQRHMVMAAQDDRHYWMKRATLPAFLIAGPLFLLAAATTDFRQPGGWAAKTPLAWPLWGALAAAVLAPAVLPLLRRVLAAGYDPNAEPADDRIRRGREFAVTKTAFLDARGRSAG